ncbi:MAG TPA: hypothetical protein VFV89_14885 [Nocardioides sp.]|uniref:hypothetical protein n=1 Tax=Nocardioides sp. TaxID=35761 RepID=UPI002E34B2D9|nr:hypothetical protein [Nocardioides sp.]HEX5089091.1 hypothetical protein [Nocardioides sp.]
MHRRLRSKRLAGLAATGVALAVPLSLGVAPVASAAPAPDIKVTQNYSDEIVPGDGLSCNSGGTDQFVSDNQYLRRFDLNFHNAGGGITISSVTMGVEIADSGDNNVPGSFNVYALDHTADLTRANLGAPLASVTVNYSNGTLDTHSVTAPVTATIPAGKDLVIEAAIDEATDDEVFFPGANEAAELGPTFLASEGCGITDPVTMGDIGFDGLAVVLFAHGKTTACKTAETNAANAATAAAAAAAGVTKATGAVDKAKKKLKKAKKSHNPTKIKKAKKKLKKAKKSLKAAQAAAAAANATLATATATQNTTCAQPALPPAPVRPAQGSSQHSTGSSNGFSFSARS